MIYKDVLLLRVFVYHQGLKDFSEERAWGALGWLHRKEELELLFKESVEIGKESEEGIQGPEKGRRRGWSWNICYSLWEQEWPADSSEPRAPNC